MRTPSLWAATASSETIYPPLSDDMETDIAIIGGGYTGLSTGLHLARDGVSAVVLDAQQPGFGASGRNGGQVNPGWKILPSEIATLFGPERANRIIGMLSGVCDLVFDLIGTCQIECDAVHPGYVRGGNGKRGETELKAWVREWNAFGAKAQWLDKHDIADLLGTRVYDCGMLDPRGGNLQPLSYARGLARAAANSGARIFGNTRVDSLTRTGSHWRLTAGGKTLVAERVVIATNGYTDHIWPGLRRNVVPVSSFISATEPLSADLLAEILPNRNAVSETRHMMMYYSKDAAGRFVIGGRGNVLNTGDQGSHAHIRREAEHIFPQLRGLKWPFAWGGTLAVTKNHVPLMLRLEDGLYAGMGYNGRGVAMASMMGLQLALAVQDKSTDMPLTAENPFKLHPLRQLGIAWHLLSGPWRDRLERG